MILVSEFRYLVRYLGETILGRVAAFWRLQSSLEYANSIGFRSVCIRKHALTYYGLIDRLKLNGPHHASVGIAKNMRRWGEEKGKR